MARYRMAGDSQRLPLLGYGRYDYVARMGSTSATPDGPGTAVSGQISATWHVAPDPNPRRHNRRLSGW